MKPLWIVLGLAALARAEPPGPWAPDGGDGTYRNPVLFADYSDPDAIRVGRDFYLVSSSFECVPGLPVLRSRDLVNWTLIGHALPTLQPAERFSAVRHGDGVWAPAIRFHAGRFWIYYPDPDAGIFVVTAADPAGPWSAPALVQAGRGLEDPCPFWDDDGRGYLIHAWARSRSGIANRLTLSRLSADGLRALDPGHVVIDADAIPGWRALEGPKLYKRGGFYYVFAPAGGVTEGWQAVFRSRSIDGPYEHRIALAQGRTAVNGPHQGAWVETPSGQDWFLHFQDRGAYGRVVWLEPMVWRADGWPTIGERPDAAGCGQPVLSHRKPDTAPAAPAVPATSDAFVSGLPGLQWQWNADPRPGWIAPLRRSPGLALACVPSGENLRDVPSLLLQKFTGPAFVATTRMEFFPAASGERAGLAVFGRACAWIGLRAEPNGRRIEAAGPGTAPPCFAAAPAAGPVYLRVAVDSAARCRFFWSGDGTVFQPLGAAFSAGADHWVGAKVGLFAAAPPDAALAKSGQADFSWFRVAPRPLP